MDPGVSVEASPKEAVFGAYVPSRVRLRSGCRGGIAVDEGRPCRISNQMQDADGMYVEAGLRMRVYEVCWCCLCSATSMSEYPKIRLRSCMGSSREG